MQDGKYGCNFCMNGPNQYRNEDSCCFSRCPKHKNIILECGCKPQDAIFEIDDGCVEDDQKFVLNRVTVDTTCLSKPVVKIEFSSIIFFEAEDDSGSEHEVEVDLLFKLIRTCNGVEECIQSWRYLKEFEIENSIDELEVEISEPFTVTYCDNPCPGCCEYKMKVKGKDFDGDFEAMRVIKPDLSALAQGKCDY
ncbi:DUF4489 domain-containing protein [Sedimentibacter sp. zth1]|uniref:DUF4489 domain-containing protein n=1 Tax=Sedimentibacter sp. zth1 TaxID=2816908 RepID=UPI001A926CA9|nr:DUF4489 domain-containing protein [Sedimentibacter sp. zth1]QSX05697.1 DUF4489 domain-containing protein [Sedimentibacter sp. zth1]